MKNIYTLILGMVLSVSALAQGTIKGRVTDATTGDGIIGANVVIEGTSTGAPTDLDGYYSFTADAGTYTIRVSYIGYKKYTKEGVAVSADQPALLNIVLEEDLGEELTAVEVVATVERGTDAVLMMDRKEANVMVQSIGSQELSRVGASDAAEGLQKVVGLSVQDNKYIIVRGLGDRYNVGMLNGFPVASPDPDKRVIPFDIFPSAVIQNLDVVKSFSPELYGDFSGASINIVTKEYPNDPILQLSLGVGLNTQSSFKDFRLDPERNADILGYNQTRELPEAIAEMTNYNSSTSTERAGTEFKTSLNPDFFTAPVNQSYGVLYGNFFGNSSRGLGVMVNANYGNGYSYQNGFNRTIDANGNYLVNFGFEDFSYSTTKSTLANFVYRFNAESDIRFYNTYTHLTTNSLIDNQGEHWDYDRVMLNRRMLYQQNELIANQLVGNHPIGDRLKVNWGLSSSMAEASEPDRRQFSYFKVGEDAYEFNAIDRREQHRFFYDLSDRDYSAKVGATYAIEAAQEEGDVNPFEIKAGVQARYKTRDFSSRIFTYFTNNINSIYPVIDANFPDQYFTQANLNNGIYNIKEDTQPSDTYDANLKIVAPYTELGLSVSDRFRLMAGLRAEMSEQVINYRLQTDSEFASIRTNVIKGFIPLPMLGLRYDVTDTDVVRWNASRTISRPDFKEVTPFQYTGFAFGFTEQGNPELQNGFNYNTDLRFERYLQRGGLFSIGLFGKYLDNPITSTFLAGSVLLQSYANADRATLAGLEVEYRRSFDFMGEANIWKELSFATNASVIYSNMVLGDFGGQSTNQTSDEVPLTGASPYLINTDLIYSKQLDNLSASVSASYNIYGRRLMSLGTLGLGNLYELPVNMLNLKADFWLGTTQRLGIGFEAKNLLNPTISTEQEIMEANGDSYTKVGEQLINEYKRGVSFGLKVNYKIFGY